MIEILDKVILTKKEMSILEKKADEIHDYRNSKVMDIRMRLPYYKPTVGDFMSHDLPLAEILPYYVYLMRKDDNNEYRFAPHDKYMNLARAQLFNIYDNRILIVKNKESAEKLASELKIKSVETKDTI